MEDYLSADFWGQDSKKAFRYLYDKYTATLRYFASRYLEDDAVIEDVVQDAFLNLWEKRGTFQAENAVKAYLYKVVRSLSVVAVIDRYNDYAIREEEDQEFFLENILESEVFLLVQSVFDELSPACREVYQLSLNGKSHEEIAQLMNISINTVKKHKNNANHYMRERLQHILSFLVWL